MPTILCLPVTQTGGELAPWNSNRHPSDVPRRHVQEIVSGRQEYRVVQGGTMDGRNCRSPQGVWTPFQQTWESNRSVRMENIGQTDLVNPWLSNGRNDFRSIDAIAARAIEPGMTDQEKAIALWWQEIQHRFHYEGDNSELMSPVKVFNIYGHNTCGNDSICMAGLWKSAGFRVAPARLVGHCVTQVFYSHLGVPRRRSMSPSSTTARTISGYFAGRRIRWAAGRSPIASTQVTRKVSRSATSRSRSPRGYTTHIERHPPNSGKWTRERNANHR